MIASVKGQVEHVENDLVVIDVGGVGVEVNIPNYVSQELRPGEAVYLHTHLVVREDSLTLYGFDTMDAREVFSMLLGVNGVGPRLALAILSTLTPDAIRRAVFQEQAEVFSRVPGVGNKTAQKILLHLQDRLPLRKGMELETAISDMDTEVLNALTVLGYSVVEAQAALQMIPRDAPQDVETRLRLALQYFTQP